MPSVTSLRKAYFTCWIGPGRCVRASLNSGLICKSQRQGVSYSSYVCRLARYPGRKGLRARRTSMYCAPRAEPNPHPRPTPTPQPPPTPMPAKPMGAPPKPQPTPKPQPIPRPNPTPFPSNLRRPISSLRHRPAVYRYDTQTAASRLYAPRRLQGSRKTKRKEVQSHTQTSQHQGNVHRLSCMSAPPTATMAINKRTTAPTPSWAKSALLHGDRTPSSARLISSNGLDALDLGGLPGGLRAPPRGPPLVGGPCCCWKSVHALSQSIFSLPSSLPCLLLMTTEIRRSRVVCLRAQCPPLDNNTDLGHVLGAVDGTGGFILLRFVLRCDFDSSHV